MSKRPSAETNERLKPGKPQDSGQPSSSSHVRSSVSFLNPDTVPGSTHLERAPSLNRLHAQSSTETSGLGETVTSGFSSQESVLSYLGDERDRSGFGDRSRRRAGGSPGSGRAVLEHESVSRERDPNLPSGLSFQQISKHQDQYLTVPQPAKRVDRPDIQTHRDDTQRSKYEPYSGDSQQATGRRQRSARDSGGRSLTPQEAKDEYDQRQRRIKQTQRKRDSDSNSVPQETRRSGTGVSASERQRSSSGHRSKEGEHTDSSVAKDHQGAQDGRRRATPSNNNTRDSGKDSKIEEHRQRGDRLDGANTATGKSKQRSKEAPATRSIPRSSAKSSSRDSLELSSNSVPTSGSARSDVASKNRDRSSSDFNISDHERRSSSKSREEIKTHSSSSSKSFDSQVSVIKPHNSKINSLTDSSVGKSKSLEIDKPALVESGQPVPVKRKQRPTPSEIARSLPKLPDPDNSGSSKLEQSQRSLDERRDPRGPQRNVHSSSKGSKSADQIEGRGPYPRQRSEPVETNNSSAKQRRDHEGSATWDNKVGGESATSKNVIHLRQEDDRYRRDKADGADASERRYGRAGARETAARVRSSDVQDSDTGRVVRRADHNPRDTRANAPGAGDRPGEGNRPKHSRERKVDPSEDIEVPHEKRSSSSSRARQTQPDRYDLEQDDHSQGRRQHYRVPADARIHHQRDGENTRSDREEEDDEIMNYERLFQEAHGRVNGTGVAGSRTHPTEGGHSAPSTRRVEGSLYGETHSNAPRSSQIHNQTSDVPSSGVAGHGASPHGRGATVSPPTSASASHVSQPPSGSAVTVKVTSPVETGLKLENVEREWERRDSRSSNKSHTSKISGLFLGVSTGSAWAKWSRERRASYQRRIEKMEQADTKVPAESAKISTPIKKARQEGLKFVSPDLEATYLTEDDLNELRRHKQQQVHAMRVIEKSRRHKFRAKHEVKMTPEEWHLLEEFWNHSIFVRARFIGILVSLLAFIFMVISITNQSWIRHNSWNLTTVEGLWVNCTKSSVIPNSEQSCHASGGRSWQNGVIGLMIFATALGFLASVLSICGVFTNPLPKKMYYFHSAGEVFFICALSASVALIVFPIAVELDSSIQTHHYSVGYGLGWVGTFLFLAAAVCLSLDDLVRESSKAKCCRWCWRGKHSDRNDLRRV